MKIENVEIRKAKHPKGDDLQKGVADLTIKDLGIDIKNINYRITKDKEIIVTAPGVSFAEKKKEKEKPPESKVIPTISFHDENRWKEVVEAIKKEISV